MVTPVLNNTSMTQEPLKNLLPKFIESLKEKAAHQLQF